MLKDFQKYIAKEFPSLGEKTVLLTVSGGVDSMVLMQLFKLADLNFVIAHCNFQLRANESDEDEKFVKSAAKKSGIKIHIKKFETAKFATAHHLSMQMAARKLRYEWFNELCVKYGCHYIATAHHQTDVAETLIINQLRGTGLAGMHGILPANGNIIRPLLFATRAQIIDFANSQKLQWREDSSNADDHYLRNKIRHKILPVFKEINPSFEKTFAENAQHFYDAELLLQSFIDEIKRKLITTNHQNYYISISKLKQLDNSKILLFYLLREFGFKNNLTTEIYESFTTTSGKKFYTETHQLIKNRDELIITKLPANATLQHGPYEILSDDDGLTGQGFSIKIKTILSGKNKNTDFKNTVEVAYLDAEKINFPLQLRLWQKGDFFYPLGMKGKRKKLSDYFIDTKISLLEKEQTWLLLSNDKICWVTGMRTDEKFKITSQTKTVLQITFFKTSY